MRPQSLVSPQLHSGFAKADPAFSPVPIWWWSGDRLNLRRLRWQVDQMVSQGVHNAVVLNLAPTGPMYGSLSDDPQMGTEEWWRIWEELCAYCAAVGMRLWFYDQLGFSGANLQARLVVSRPDYAGMSVQRVSADVAGAGEIRIPETGVVIAASALPLSSGGNVTGAPEPLAVDNSIVRWRGKGHARLMAAYAIRKGFDYHSPEACAALTAIVHGRFEKRLKRFFGTVIVGSFQDELPAVPTWSGRFEEEFRKRAGYAIAPWIAALWEDWGAESARVRLDYQRVRAALAEEAMFRPLLDWHERHGLTFGFDQQSPSRGAQPLSTVEQYADYARTHRWYSAPGSDHWGDAKFHSSLAHSYRRPRTWIESFHSSGWGGTLEETFDWLQPWILAGANLYNPHAVYYSTRGGQWEWAPPSTCWRQPYWRHYRIFSDAISGLCWLATQGEHVCDVAVLFPSASVQADLFLDHAGAKARAAHAAYMDLVGSMVWFNARAGVLARLLRDFDVLDDDTLAKASVKEGALHTRAERYRVLIVPECFILETETAKRLADFAKAGGVLVFAGALPEATDMEKGAAAIEALRALAAEGGVKVIASRQKMEQALTAIFEEIRPEVAADSPVLLRRTGSTSMLFVTAAAQGSATAQPMLPWANWDYDHDHFSMARYNDELREKGYDFDPVRNRRSATVRLSGPVGAIEQWDPVTGDVRPAIAAERDGATEVTVDFSSCPMAVVVWTRDGTRQSRQPAPPDIGEPLALEGAWRTRIVPTIDNRHGDFALPARPGPLPVEAWQVGYRADDADTPHPDWKPEEWPRVPVSDGLRAWRFGPADPALLPDPLPPGHRGPLEGREWMPVNYSLSRGIDHDGQHDKTLGPKARIPEPFVRIHNVEAGQAVLLRTALPVSKARRLTLAVGGNGTKQVWWNGRECPAGEGGYLQFFDVQANAGLDMLELRLTAVKQGDLAFYWALTADREAFRRPEWLEPAGKPEAGTTLVMSRTVELPAVAEFVAHFGSLGVAAFCVNGSEVARHGGFDPYEGWNTARVMKYRLTPYVKEGRNEIEIRYTDNGGPMALLFDGLIYTGDGSAPRALISDGGWRASRKRQPAQLTFRLDQRLDPRFYMLYSRPHPLPRTGWLDPEQPVAGVFDIVPEPNPGKPKPAQWFAICLPPGARHAHLPVTETKMRVFLGGSELAVKGGAVELPGCEQLQRTLLVRVETDDGRVGGAVWNGPVTFAVEEGRMLPGSWADMGLAFYSGGVEYVKHIAIGDPLRFSLLDLGNVRGTAEIKINGEPAGARIWSPYRFDITGRLRPGENQIVVRVFNTIAPYLKGASPTRSIYKGQDHSGLLGPVRLLPAGS